MKTSVTGRHVEITPEIQALIDHKLEKLTRLLHDSAVSAQVVLSQRSSECSTELVLHARGDHVLHGDGGGSSWVEAVGIAVDKVEHQAQTLKGKWEDRRRRTRPDG